MTASIVSLDEVRLARLQRVRPAVRPIAPSPHSAGFNDNETPRLFSSGDYILARQLP